MKKLEALVKNIMQNMEKFGEEKYSREAYENAKKDSGAAWGRIGEARERIYNKSGGTKRGNMREIYNRSWADWKEAKKRVENLYAKSQEEATTLNQEYDLLRTQAQEAIEEYDRIRIRAEEALDAIVDFEREKLGMHGQDSASPK